MNEVTLRVTLRVWLGFSRSIFAIARDPIDLGIRIFLAQAFVVTSVMAMSTSHGHSQMMSAGAMVASSSLAGLLFTLGLFTRLSAGSLLVFAVAQQLGLEASEPNLFIVALLGWHVVRGPGALSIDRAIALGLRASALPLAQPVMGGLDGLRTRVAPIYLLVSRLWLAMAITGVAGETLWIPSAKFATLPLWLKVLATVLVVPGLGLPVILALLTLGFAGMQAMDPALQLNLYLLLFLILLGLHTGGALTIYAPIAQWLHSHRLFDRPRDPLPTDCRRICRFCNQ